MFIADRDGGEVVSNAIKVGEEYPDWEMGKIEFGRRPLKGRRPPA